MKKLNQCLQFNKFKKFLKQNNFIIHIDNKILKLDCNYLNKKIYNGINFIRTKLNFDLIKRLIEISNNVRIYKSAFSSFLITFLVFNKIKQTIKKLLTFKFLSVQIYNKFYFFCNIDHLFFFNYNLNNKLIYKFLLVYTKFFFNTK